MPYYNKMMMMMRNQIIMISYSVLKQRSAFVSSANLVFIANDRCVRDYELVVAYC